MARRVLWAPQELLYTGALNSVYCIKSHCDETDSILLQISGYEHIVMNLLLYKWVGKGKRQEKNPWLIMRRKISTITWQRLTLLISVISPV